MVIMHANSYPPACYSEMGEALSRQAPVLIPKQRPFWPSSVSGDWRKLENWQVFGDDLLRFLDENRIEKAVAIGHSLGGVASYYAALKQPERFTALVLIEPVFLDKRLLLPFKLGMSASKAAERIPLVKAARNRRQTWPSQQAAFDHFRPKSVFKKLSDEMLWDYVKHGLRPLDAADDDDARLLAAMRKESTSDREIVVDDEHGRPSSSPRDHTPLTLAFPRDWEAQIYCTPPTDVWTLLPEFAALRIPTLALRGAETDTISNSSWTEWQKIQPRADFRDLPGLGHLLPLEDPTAIVAETRRFLDGLAGN